jgi:hypothetical protein
LVGPAVCATEVTKVRSHGDGVQVFPGSYYHEHGPGPGEVHDDGDAVAAEVLAGV